MKKVLRLLPSLLFCLGLVYYIEQGSLREVKIVGESSFYKTYHELSKSTTVELIETKRRIILEGSYGEVGETFYIRTLLP